MDKTGKRDSHATEQKALRLSVWGAVLMAVLGIGFTLLTSSEAILLDGLFSLVNFAVGLVTLRVATLVRLPDDDDFPFGYAGFEPLLNLCKGLLIAFLSLFALTSAVIALLHGGRAIQAGYAVIYAAVAGVGCLAIALSQRRMGRNTSSPLVQVDAKNWLIDGLISGAVGVAFLVTMLLEGTSWAFIVPYADPLVVALLVAFTAVIPIRIITENLNQLLLGAPDKAYRDAVRKRVQAALGELAVDEMRFRLVRVGRASWLHLYVIVAPDHRLADVRELDLVRDAVAEKLRPDFDNLAVDVIFTKNRRWSV